MSVPQDTVVPVLDVPLLSSIHSFRFPMDVIGVGPTGAGLGVVVVGLTGVGFVVV